MTINFPTWFLVAMTALGGSAIFVAVVDMVLDHAYRRHPGQHRHWFVRHSHTDVGLDAAHKPHPERRHFHLYWWHWNHGGGR